jgi:hypothetical protein
LAIPNDNPFQLLQLLQLLLLLLLLLLHVITLRKRHDRHSLGRVETSHKLDNKHNLTHHTRGGPLRLCLCLSLSLSLSLSLHKENGRFFTQFHNFFVLDKIEFCKPELATHKCEFREHFGDGNRDATSEEREESSRIPDTWGLGLPAAETTAGSGRVGSSTWEGDGNNGGKVGTRPS